MPVDVHGHVPLYRILVNGQRSTPPRRTASTRSRSPTGSACRTSARSRSATPPAREGAAVPDARRLQVRRSARSSRSSSAPPRRRVDPDALQGRDRHRRARLPRRRRGMVVRAYDKTHRMMRARKQRTFADQTTSDIVEQDLRRVRPPVAARPSGDAHKIVLQHNETDWDFVLRLARRIGFEFVVDDGQGDVRSARRRTAAPVELELPGRPARLPAAHHRGAAGREGQRARLRPQGQEGGPGHQVVAAAGHERRDHPQPGRVQVRRGRRSRSAGSRSRTSGEADAMAQAALDQLANAYLGAEGSCAGNPKIKAGVLLKISGVGRNYSGTYRVAKAVARPARRRRLRHRSSPTRPASTPCSASPAAATAARARGRLDRRRHRDQQQGPRQARPREGHAPGAERRGDVLGAGRASPRAGKERGLSMLPVPDEQVIVAFENGDPLLPLRPRLAVQRQGQAGRGAGASTTARSRSRATTRRSSPPRRTSRSGPTAASGDQDRRRRDHGDRQGGRRRGGYTGDFDGAYELKATQAVTIESNQVGDDQGAVDHGRGAGPLPLKGATVRHRGDRRMVNISGAHHQPRIGSEIDDGAPRLGPRLPPQGRPARRHRARVAARRTSTRRSSSSSAPRPASGRCGRSSAAASTTSCSTRSTPTTVGQHGDRGPRRARPLGAAHRGRATSTSTSTRVDRRRAADQHRLPDARDQPRAQPRLSLLRHPRRGRRRE